MARHSKWHNIKHRKAAQDAMKGKTYAIHSKLIALAAQSGGDPVKNPSLFTAVANAKKDGVPADNIDRAIKKWTGEDKDGIQISNIVYEWYAPGGVALIISTLTDNKNRTAANMRHIFSKFSGSMGEPGSVSWIFSKKWVIIFNKEWLDLGALEELIFETSVDDMKDEGEIVKIITGVESLEEVKAFFQSKWLQFEEAGTEYIPSNEVNVEEFDKALKITKMVEALEEDEDVEDYSMNYVISEQLQQEVDEFIEKNTFRT